MFPKIGFFLHQIIHLFIGFSIIFTIHFGGQIPIFLVQHPYVPFLGLEMMKTKPWTGSKTWSRVVLQRNELVRRITPPGNLQIFEFFNMYWNKWLSRLPIYYRKKLYTRRFKSWPFHALRSWRSRNNRLERVTLSLNHPKKVTIAELPGFFFDMSSDQNPTHQWHEPWNTDWFMGILILAYYNRHISG